MNRGKGFIAWILIGFGGLMLAGNILDIDISNLFWPIFLIVIGFILIFRPPGFRWSEDARFAFAGDYDLGRTWDVKDEEFFVFAGDFDIDLTKADLPAGETRIKVNAFASEVNIWVPEDIGIAIDASGIVTKLEKDGREEESIFAGIDYVSEGYKEAPRRLHLTTVGFVSEIDLNRR